MNRFRQITSIASRLLRNESAFGALRQECRSFGVFVNSRWAPESCSSRAFSSGSKTAEKVNITFVDKDGKEQTVKAAVGKSLLDVAHDNEVELEGACEGSLACSTCHVILDRDVYDKLEEPTDDEQDMLDLAFGLTDTSRLGCQIIVKPELDGIKVRLPAATRNMAVDGYKSKPH